VLPTWLLLILPVTLCVSCREQPRDANAAEPTPQVNAAEPTPQVAATRNPLEMPTPVVGQPYPGRGVVTVVNRREGWVEIRHEEIKGLMPAMQMEWSVKDGSMLKSIRVGDGVEFTVVETGSGEILTELKRVPAIR
jgi:Cu/Ag efflux protein CusF